MRKLGAVENVALSEDYGRGKRQVVTRSLVVPEGVDLVTILGPADKTVRVLEKGFPSISILVHGRTLSIAGDETQVNTARSVLNELVRLAQSGSPLDAEGVKHAVGLLANTPMQAALPGINSHVGAVVTGRGRGVRAKTPGQQEYMNSLARAQITFGIGPAGTGKTYLAMAQAISDLLDGKVRRLILTRPAVEAGENLGFLPGSLSDKIDPYLRPLYDALQDLLEDGTLPGLMESGAVEVAPLAYMRGRTLNDSFVIVDEAQNTTTAQMKMLLTRLGEGSRMAVTGDVTQIDLGGAQTSGLVQAAKILDGIDGVHFQYLTSADVVRTRLVADIVDAYSDWELRHPKSERRR
mgnify:FL=1